MTDEQPHLSVTQLKTYLRCPLQYYFRYVCDLKAPPTGDMTLGRVVHNVLEDNYRQKIETRQDLPLDQMTDLFSDHWDSQVQETTLKPGESPGPLKDQGIQLLAPYHREIAPTIQPVEVERRFLLDTGATRRPLMGYIDLVDDQGTVIDHKTTKRSFPEGSAEKDLQLTAYAFAHRALYGEAETGLRLDVLVRTKEPKVQQLATTRTQADIDRFLRLAEHVERGIDAGVAYPNDNYMCGTCGYGSMCEQW